MLKMESEFLLKCFNGVGITDAGYVGRTALREKKVLRWDLSFYTGIQRSNFRGFKLLRGET